MMHATLIPHPTTPCDVVTSLEASLEYSDTEVRLTYAVQGDLDNIRWPQPAPPLRTDHLWEHTCFEVFVRKNGEACYRELNFAPSTRWAAYGFKSYRACMAELQIPELPRIECRRGDRKMQMGVSIPKMAVLDGDGPWSIGLSAVLEELNGRKSYWALRHPSAQPDFHHADAFAMALP